MVLDSPHQRRILDCCNNQGGALEELQAVNYYRKSFTKDLAAVLEPPLLITPKLSFSNCICKNLFESYPPPYEKRVQRYKYLNTVQIKNALASFNWQQALSNISIDKKISVPTETIINVMSNYVLSETKAFYDQDLSWMNAEIENLITAKNEA